MHKTPDASIPLADAEGDRRLGGDAPLRVRLVRHARADYAGLTGTPEMVDAPLSPQGEAQCSALVERLRGDPPGYLYCSPTGRAMATAHAIASGLGMRPVARSLLCEDAFLHGAPGLVPSELAARFPLIVLPEEIREEGWTGNRTREDDIPWSRRARQVLNRSSCLFRTGNGVRTGFPGISRANT